MEEKQFPWEESGSPQPPAERRSGVTDRRTGEADRRKEMRYKRMYHRKQDRRISGIKDRRKSP